MKAIKSTRKYIRQMMTNEGQKPLKDDYPRLNTFRKNGLNLRFAIVVGG